MSALVDWRDNPITPGATVLYSVKESTFVNTVEATVDAIEGQALRLTVTRETWCTYRKRPRRTTVSAGNVTVIDQPCPDCHWDAT